MIPLHEYLKAVHGLKIHCPVLQVLVGALVISSGDVGDPGVHAAIKSAQGLSAWGASQRASRMTFLARSAIGWSNSFRGLALMMSASINDIAGHYMGAAALVVEAYREAFGDVWAPVAIAMLLTDMEIVRVEEVLP